MVFKKVYMWARSAESDGARGREWQRNRQTKAQREMVKDRWREKERELERSNTPLLISGSLVQYPHSSTHPLTDRPALTFTSLAHVLDLYCLEEEEKTRGSRLLCLGLSADRKLCWSRTQTSDSERESPPSLSADDSLNDPYRFCSVYYISQHYSGIFFLL